MKTERPDVGVLDDLVAGIDNAEESEAAWRWIVGHPDGTAVWGQAARRRESLDRLAAAVLGRPLLARALRMVGRVRGPFAGQEAIAINFATPSAVQAMLGPTADEGEGAVTMMWGAIETLGVPADHSVRFEVPNAEDVALYFQYAKGTGRLPGSWKMERGDSPVLIVACKGSTAAERFEDGLVRASDAAAVVLVERTGTGGAGDEMDED